MRRIVGNARKFRRLVSLLAKSSAGVGGAERKPRARILAELVDWRRRSGAARHYFAWGLDRRDAPDLQSVFTYREFTALRNRHNRRRIGRGHPTQTLIIDDKYLFGLFVKATGHPSPATIAVAEGEVVHWLDPRRREPLGSLLDRDAGVDVFCKRVFGNKGRGVFKLQVSEGVLRIDGEAASLGQLSERLSTRHVLQERIIQHPAVSAIYPHSINTLRLVTVRSGGVVEPFSLPVFRIGSRGSVVDNWSAGGILVLVDRSTGRLMGQGNREGAEALPAHPDTGTRFDGFQIPFFVEAVELAVRLHEDLPEIHSVGWDLAITPEGPTVIEGNSSWSAAVRIAADPDFRREFDRLCAPDPVGLPSGGSTRHRA